MTTTTNTAAETRDAKRVLLFIWRDEQIVADATASDAAREQAAWRLDRNINWMADHAGTNDVARIYIEEANAEYHAAEDAERAAAAGRQVADRVGFHLSNTRTPDAALQQATDDALVIVTTLTESAPAGYQGDPVVFEPCPDCGTLAPAYRRADFPEYVEMRCRCGHESGALYAGR